MVFSLAGQSLLDLVHVRTQGFQGFRGFQGIEDGMVPPGIIIPTGLLESTNVLLGFSSDAVMGHMGQHLP